jgi:hypothetical protein
MLDALSFAEMDNLHVELMPARTLMSLFGLDGDPAAPASGDAPASGGAPASGAAPATGPVVVSDGPGDSTVIADTCSAPSAGALTCIPAAIVNNHG